jgi:hypothetical protein
MSIHGELDDSAVYREHDDEKGYKADEAMLGQMNPSLPSATT